MRAASVTHAPPADPAAPAAPEFAVNYGLGTLGRALPQFWALIADLDAGFRLYWAASGRAAVTWARRARQEDRP